MSRSFLVGVIDKMCPFVKSMNGHSYDRTFPKLWRSSICAFPFVPSGLAVYRDFGESCHKFFNLFLTLISLLLFPQRKKYDDYKTWGSRKDESGIWERSWVLPNLHNKEDQKPHQLWWVSTEGRVDILSLVLRNMFKMRFVPYFSWENGSSTLEKKVCSAAL